MPSPREQPPSPANRRRRQEVMPGGWLWLLILAMLVGVLWFTMSINNASQIPYSEFLKLVEEHQFATVDIVGNSLITGELKESPEKLKLPSDLKISSKLVAA